MADKKEEQQEFFVRIDNPAIFRKNLLLASKLTLGVLKQSYSLNHLRETKIELVELIRNEVKELKVLVQNLYDLMPKHSRDEIIKKFPDATVRRPEPRLVLPRERVRKERVEKPQPAPQPKPKLRLPPRPQGPVSEVDKLTRALKYVERQLAHL